MRNDPESDETLTQEDVLPEEHTDWARIKAMTGEEALRNALADPDNPPLTDDEMGRMRRVPNPKEIRERLGLTQREFSRRFQIALGTLRDWEQGARRPDSAAKAYLRVIERYPREVFAALNEQLARSWQNEPNWSVSEIPNYAEVKIFAAADPNIQGMFLGFKNVRPEPAAATDKLQIVQGDAKRAA